MSEPIRLGAATVTIHDGWTHTRFEDGELHALHSEQPGQAEMVSRLGYETPEEMNRDHDLAHSILAALLGLDGSPTLRAISKGMVWPLWHVEEEAALALQKYAQTMGIDLVDVARRLSR